MLTDRPSARAAGHRFYLPANPCRRGHTATRYVSTGGCTECLREWKDEDRRLAAASASAIYQGVRLFAYRLHPDDHAAALSYCQGLDLQRGREPSAAPVDFTPPKAALRAAEPHEIAQHRERLQAQLDSAQRVGGEYLTAEMAATLRAHGLPV